MATTNIKNKSVKTSQKVMDQPNDSTLPMPKILPERTFRAEWDEEGVFFYQAYNDDIANWSLEHQKLGGPQFKPFRMTWIKPSFAWMLYRARYGSKDSNQTRILKIKLSHATVSDLLSQCKLSTHAGRGGNGRIQWDPERDIMSGNGKDPKKVRNTRAIQIGLNGHLSELYVNNILSIEDVSAISGKIGKVHAQMSMAISSKNLQANPMKELIDQLPVERPYVPACSKEVMHQLGTYTGETHAGVK
jgi:hypothetical protein